MSTISHPLAIRAMQLRTQISAVKCEKRGMRRRGRSVTAMLKDFYGLPRGANHDTVLASLNDELANVDEQLLGSATSEEFNS